MWGRDEGGQSYYVISIKRLKIADWGIMIFNAERMKNWEMETARRCRREERRCFQARWNDSPLSSCSKDSPLKAQTYTQLWRTQTAVFAVRILEIDLLQRCCTTKANLHSMHSALPKPITIRFLQISDLWHGSRVQGKLWSLVWLFNLYCSWILQVHFKKGGPLVVGFGKYISLAHTHYSGQDWD